MDQLKFKTLVTYHLQDQLAACCHGPRCARQLPVAVSLSLSLACLLRLSLVVAIAQA